MPEKNLSKPVPAKLHRVYRALGLELDAFTTLDEQKDYFFLFSERIYSLDGNLLNEKEYADSGELIQETQNTYNEAGKLLHYQLHSDGVLAENIEYTYDEKGKLTSERHSFEEGLPVHRRYRYDEKDRIIEVLSEDDDGELNERETFVYSEQFPDYVAHQIKYNEDNEPEAEEQSEYAEVEENGEKKIVLTERKYINHVNNSIRRITHFRPSSREDGVISITYNSNDKVTDIERVVINDAGHETEHHIESVNVSDNLQVYNEHDEHGRIVKQEQRQKDRILVKVERKFNAEHHVEVLSYRSASRGIYLDVAQFEYYS